MPCIQLLQLYTYYGLLSVKEALKYNFYALDGHFKQNSFMFMGSQDCMVSRVIRLHAGWPEIHIVGGV